MKKLSFLLAAILAVPTLSHANDTAVSGIGGRWQIVQKEHPSIRMVREKIDITLNQTNKAATVADFVFQNTGPATQVEMGFPESGYGDINPNSFKNKPSFTRFKTWVDGVPFTAKRRFTPPGEGSFSALWVKKVPFRAGQTRRVRVRYQSEWGQMSAFPSDFVTYDFTGGNWKGKVESSVLTVNLNIPGTYLVSIDKFEKDKPQFKRQGNKFIYTWNNWEAQQAFAFRFDTTLRNWLDNNVQGLPVIIPARNGQPKESEIGYVPAGVHRNGQIFINLRSWLDWAQEQKIATSSYDAPTRSIKVRQGTRTISIPVEPEAQGFTVQNRYGFKVLYLPATDFKRFFGDSFKFKVDPHRHLLQFVK